MLGGQAMKLRAATIADVPVAVGIVNEYAERGLMIHRSPSEMYDRLRDFVIAEEDGRVIGLAGLRVMWANLAEVYSLAVRGEARGRGVGRALVEATIADARRLEIHRVFALTYERVFFERLGFSVVDRRTLPLKVWGECIRCPKHEACDEIAVVRELAEVPDHGQAMAGGLDSARAYDVPVPRLTHAVLRVDRQASDDSTSPSA